MTVLAFSPQETASQYRAVQLDTVASLYNEGSLAAPPHKANGGLSPALQALLRRAS